MKKKKTLRAISDLFLLYIRLYYFARSREKQCASLILRYQQSQNCIAAFV